MLRVESVPDLPGVWRPRSHCRSDVPEYDGHKYCFDSADIILARCYISVSKNTRREIASGLRITWVQSIGSMKFAKHGFFKARRGKYLARLDMVCCTPTCIK